MIKKKGSKDGGNLRQSIASISQGHETRTNLMQVSVKVMRHEKIETFSSEMLIDKYAYIAYRVWKLYKKLVIVYSYTKAKRMRVGCLCQCLVGDHCE